LGPFRLGSVEVEVLEGVRSYPEEVTRLADENWQSLLQQNSNLFDGPNWSLVRREVRGEGSQRRLCLAMQRSSYRFMQFTHMTPHGRAAVPLASRCNGAGLMALTETSDGALLFGLRSRRAGALPLHWHCMPAGVVDAPDPAAVLRKELVEETGFEWPAVTACEFLAIMLTGEEQGDKPEFVFRLVLAASARDIYGRRRAAEDSAEHEALAFVRIPGRDGPQPWAVEGGEAAPKDLFFADLDGFVEGKLGPLTDVSKRALALLRALGVPPVMPLLP